MLDALRDEGEAELCDALDLLGSHTGENRFRHASSVIRGACAGRKPIDDTDDLAEIAALEAKGHRRSKAIAITARRHADASATAESLARRYRGRLAKISG